MLKFDAIIIREKEFNAESLLIPLVERGIDIVCVAGEGTADPGFAVQKAAKLRDDKILVIPGAVVLGSNDLYLLIIGAVDKIAFPTRGDTDVLTHAVRANGGVTIALQPNVLVDSPGWTLVDGSVVWYENVLYPRTVPATLAVTGYNGTNSIGRVYTSIDFDGCIKSYNDFSKLVITNPEKFSPVVLKSGEDQ